MNISNEKLFNAAKCQVYSFYHFWVFKKNQQDRGISPTTNIRVKEVNFDEIKISWEWNSAVLVLGSFTKFRKGLIWRFKFSINFVETEFHDRAHQLQNNFTERNFFGGPSVEVALVSLRLTLKSCFLLRIIHLVRLQNFLKN